MYEHSKSCEICTECDTIWLLRKAYHHGLIVFYTCAEHFARDIYSKATLKFDYINIFIDAYIDTCIISSPCEANISVY